MKASARKPASRGRGAKGPSPVARGLKLLLLVGACVCIGFFVVLVIDVGASLVGQMKLGDTTVSGLVDKVIARVLDEDVPRVEPRPAPPPPARPRAVERERREQVRAPVPAARPEDDARHVEARPDPEVERAKQRLDEILGRL